MELQTQTLLPSPTSSTSSSNNNNNNNGSFPTTPKQVVQPPLTRSESNPYPTTFVQADTSSFKQVVQMLTGSTTPKPKPIPTSKPTNPNTIPPIKSPNKSKPSKLYERRSTTLKNLRLTTHTTTTTTNEILSPSLLDFPSLVLSPVTPLIHDPFIRSPISSNSSPSPCRTRIVDQIAEEKAIAEKGFFFHPSPVSTPRDSEPRLLPLFPLSSPKMLSSGSNNHHLTS